MNYYKKNGKRAVKIYALGSGLTWNRTDGNMIRILCDAFSLCTAVFFLTTYWCRPRNYTFMSVARFYVKRLRNIPPADAKEAELHKELELSVTNDFLESLFLFLISFVLMVLFYLLYVIFC